MGLFHKIEDAQAIISSRGVYRQVDVYQRDGYVYVKWGNGFIWLGRNGTSKPDVMFHELFVDDEIDYSRTGRMTCVPRNVKTIKEVKK